jgi:hypothetical protein
MKLDYGRSISRALRFGFTPKRWLPLLLLNLTLFTLIITFIMISIPLFGSLFGGEAGGVQTLPMLGILGPLILIAILWWLLAIWITGAIINQTYKEDGYMKSFQISLNRYLCLLAAMILVAVISGLVGFVPYVGWIFSIIVGLMFFFAMQGVMITKLGPVDALKNSYMIFRKHMLDVFLIWLIAVLITLAIVLVFAIPLLILFLGLLIPMLSVSSAQAVQAGMFTVLMESLGANFSLLIITGIIAVIGMSIAQAFSFKLQTEFYLQFKKKKLGII